MNFGQILINGALDVGSEDVVRLDVQMQEAQRVDVSKSLGHLDASLQDALPAENIITSPGFTISQAGTVRNRVPHLQQRNAKPLKTKNVIFLALEPVR